MASAVFLGMTPIFGKQAIQLGMSPLAVVAFRTLLAALLLLLVMALFFRRYLYIYPAGLLGCTLAGGVNGLGSLFFYSALGRIDASLGQFLYALYPLFLVMWLWLDHQAPSRLTLLRLMLALPAILLLVQVGQEQVDMVGVVMMLVASALYALHLPINQRVLYDMPAQTVTLYTLLAMSCVVLPAFFIGSALGVGGASFSGSPSNGVPEYWAPVLVLALVTFFSRLTLFLGVKQLGGMQTALLGLSELLVTLFLAYLLLGERFTSQQWLGAILLVASLALVILEKPPPGKYGRGGFLNWLRPARLTPKS